jgi:replicative DNA helicase
MNIQKLGIKRLLVDKDVHFLHQLTNSYFTKSYKTIYKLIESYYDSKGKLPAKDDLLALFQNKLSEEKAETFKAIIKSLDKIESDMTADEILKELKKHKLLIEVESRLEDLVKAGENKDIKTLMSTINDLNNKVNNIENNYVPADVKEVEFKNVNLVTLDSCLPTLRNNGINITNLTILGAKSGNGKSLLAIQQALYTYEQGHSVAFLSLELPESLLLMRMYANVNKVSIKEIMANPDKKNIIDKWKETYFNRENKFYIKHRRYTAEEVKSVVRMLAKQGVQLIVIDYLGLIEFDNNYDDWRNLANLVKDLHALSVELGVVILSPTQINIEESKSGSVNITTRNSKELIFSSSLFLVLHANEEEKAEGVSRLIVEKARSAQQMTLMVKNNFEYMAIEDLGIIV